MMAVILVCVIFVLIVYSAYMLGRIHELRKQHRLQLKRLAEYNQELAEIFDAQKRPAKAVARFSANSIH